VTTKKIDPPRKHKAEAIARRGVRGIVGLVPVVGSLAAEAVDGLMPDAEAMDRERWEDDVTDGVNYVGSRVDEIDGRTGKKSQRIEGLAAELISHMLRSCRNGIQSDFTALEDLAAAFPDADEQAVAEAMADLESFHLVQRYRLLDGHGEFRLTDFAYEQIDRQLMGWDTQEDAKELMRIVGAETGSIKARELQKRTGWSLRRFNPALRIVLRQIDDRRISRPLESALEYSAGTLHANEVERATMRRLARG
jgi:hypothetical protein